jgi:hypothetical protein
MPRSRSKRQKTIPKDPQEDEELPTAHSMANSPSSSVWSLRQLPSKHTLPLIVLCIRVFASNFRQLAADSSKMEPMKEQMKLIPDSLIPRLLAGLREACPTFLSHEFISTVSHTILSTTPSDILCASIYCVGLYCASVMIYQELETAPSWPSLV